MVLSEGLMYAGSKVVMYGKYKSMKSMLAQRFMLSCARGEPWLGFNTPVQGLNVYYLQLEIPEPLLHERLWTMSGGSMQGVLKEPYVCTEHFLKLDTPQGMAALERELDATKPDVLIMDPLFKLLSGNMMDGHQVSTFLDNIDKLIANHGISVMLLSHSRKPPAKEEEETGWGSDDLLGSVLLSAWADSVIRVSRKGPIIEVKFEVVRHSKKEIRPQTLNLTEGLQFRPAIKV